jgi:hypothetical protein
MRPWEACFERSGGSQPSIIITTTTGICATIRTENAMTIPNTGVTPLPYRRTQANAVTSKPCASRAARSASCQVLKPR